MVYENKDIYINERYFQTAIHFGLINMNHINDFCHISLNTKYYHTVKGYLRKITVERRTISRAERRMKFSLKTGIFRKYSSQT
jgi:hypothetical protein